LSLPAAEISFRKRDKPKIAATTTKVRNIIKSADTPTKLNTIKSIASSTANKNRISLFIKRKTNTTLTRIKTLNSGVIHL
jgi:hypothetical protein